MLDRLVPSRQCLAEALSQVWTLCEVQGVPLRPPQNPCPVSHSTVEPLGPAQDHGSPRSSTFLPSEVLGGMAIQRNPPQTVAFGKPPRYPRPSVRRRTAEARGTGGRAAKLRSSAGGVGNPAPAGRSPPESGDTGLGRGRGRSPRGKRHASRGNPAGFGAWPRLASILC